MKKFFAKLCNFLHFLFGLNLDAWVDEHVTPSVEFIMRFKKVVDSPGAHLLTTLIPGDWDDKLREQTSERLGKALDIYFGGYVAAEDNPTFKVLKAIQMMNEATEAAKDSAYFKLASIYTKLSAGDAGLEQVKNHSVDLLVQTKASQLIAGLEHHDLPEIPADCENNNDEKKD